MSDRGHDELQTNSQHRFNRGITAFLYGISILYASYYITVSPLLVMARKAKQVEGHLNIGAISRGQQAYFFENKTFARKIVDLGLGIRWETNDYSYRIVYPSYPTHTQSSMPKTQNFPAIASIAYPKSEGLRTYLAMEWLAIDSATKELRNYSIRCRSEKSFEKLKSSKDKMLWFSKFSSPRQNNEDATMTCPTGFTKMS